MVLLWYLLFVWPKKKRLADPWNEVINFTSYTTVKSWVFNGYRYPLVNVYVTIGNHHAINGKTHYFYDHFQELCNKLPEGNVGI